MKIEEFLYARVNDVIGKSLHLPWAEYYAIHVLCDNQRALLEWHKNWPIMVETRPELNVNDDYDNVNAMTHTMSQQIAWMTQEEYRKQFGSEPPTAPLLKKWAESYREHPDFDESW